MLGPNRAEETETTSVFSKEGTLGKVIRPAKYKLHSEEEDIRDFLSVMVPCNATTFLRCVPAPPLRPITESNYNEIR